MTFKILTTSFKSFPSVYRGYHKLLIGSIQLRDPSSIRVHNLHQYQFPLPDTVMHHLTIVLVLLTCLTNITETCTICIYTYNHHLHFKRNAIQWSTCYTRTINQRPFFPTVQKLVKTILFIIRCPITRQYLRARCNTLQPPLPLALWVLPAKQTEYERGLNKATERSSRVQEAPTSITELYSGF
jgi:hypothetical protein